MSPTSQISVVIPTYNRSNVVARAIQSALVQIPRPREIIVVDDGSTDSTAATMTSFDARLVRYVAQPNQGVAVARNRGVQESTGAYVAFLDSDDWWLPGRLAKLEDAISRSPSTSLWYSHAHVVSEAGAILRTLRPLDLDSGNAYWKLLQRNVIVASSVAVKRECFDELGGFDPGVTGVEDWDMWLRIAKTHKLGVIPAPLTVYSNASSDSYVVRDPDQWVQSFETARQKHIAAGRFAASQARQLDSIHEYTKGLVYLKAGQEASARQHFRRAWSASHRRFEAQLYEQLLCRPYLRRILPSRLLTGLGLNPRRDEL